MCLTIRNSELISNILMLVRTPFGRTITVHRTCMMYPSSGVVQMSVHIIHVPDYVTCRNRSKRGNVTFSDRLQGTSHVKNVDKTSFVINTHTRARVRGLSFDRIDGKWKPRNESQLYNNNNNTITRLNEHYCLYIYMYNARPLDEMWAARHKRKTG